MEPTDSTVNLMKTDHYKITVLLGCTCTVMHSAEVVLDTGAGPNFVRKSLLPSDWNRYSAGASGCPPIRHANNRRLKLSGVVPMYVDIGGLKLRISFLVCRELAVHAILGCDFIQKYVEAILPQESKVVLRYGGAIAIQTKRPKVMANMFSPSPAHDHPSPRKRRVRSRTDCIKLEKPASIPPFSETIIQVRGGSGGLQRIEPAGHLMRKHKLPLLYAVIDSIPSKSIAMTLASISSKIVNL